MRLSIFSLIFLSPTLILAQGSPSGWTLRERRLSAEPLALEGLMQAVPAAGIYTVSAEFYIPRRVYGDSNPSVPWTLPFKPLAEGSGYRAFSATGSAPGAGYILVRLPITVEDGIERWTFNNAMFWTRNRLWYVLGDPSFRYSP